MFPFYAVGFCFLQSVLHVTLNTSFYYGLRYVLDFVFVISFILHKICKQKKSPKIQGSSFSSQGTVGQVARVKKLAFSVSAKPLIRERLY